MKKSLSILLAFTLMLTLAATAFAMDGNAKITGMAQGLGLGYSGSGGNIDLGEVYPQDERVEYIALYDNMFTWDTELPATATPTQLTASQIRAARLDVRSNKQNSKVVDSITLNSRESRIEVKFKKEYVGTKEIDFDFDVFLTIDGRRQNDHGVNFTGTFTNQVVELYGDYGSVDISDGSVAEAMESISKLEVDLGDGVTVTTRLSKGKRIYGTTDRTPSSSDDEVMREHKDITDVITMHTAGFSSGSTVKLGAEFRSGYVYSGDLKYLGKSGDELPFTEKYFISAKKLDIADEEPAGSTSVPTEDNKEPATPAVDQTPKNANDNPGTGR